MIRQMQQTILDSLGTDELCIEAKVSFTKTANLLQKAVKLTNPLLNDDVFFANDNLSIMKVHPNPATVAGYLDYNMNGESKAKITISNLLGKVVDEFSLQRGEHKLKIPTINYDAGIYFYTLSINGKTVKSKKLVVAGK